MPRAVSFVLGALGSTIGVSPSYDAGKLASFVEFVHKFLDLFDQCCVGRGFRSKELVPLVLSQRAVAGPKRRRELVLRKRSCLQKHSRQEVKLKLKATHT